MNSTDAKAEVKATIEQFFHSMDVQDAALMDQVTPPDSNMVHIGTDADEVWKGVDELQQATEEQFRNLEFYRAQIRDLTINLSRSGDVAWYFHLLDARIGSGGEETIWEGARFTGVLEKREGQWMLVQTHVSVPDGS